MTFLAKNNNNNLKMEMLILTISSYPVLYNTALKDYKNNLESFDMMSYPVPAHICSGVRQKYTHLNPSVTIALCGNPAVTLPNDNVLTRWT